MSYEHYNPHPKGIKTGDCVVRAFTKALGTDYLETRRTLNRYKREEELASYKHRVFLDRFARKNGWKKISLPVIKGEKRDRAIDLTYRFPKGTYILNMRNHIVTMVDGIVYDSWNSLDNIVYNLYLVKE